MNVFKMIEDAGLTALLSDMNVLERSATLGLIAGYIPEVTLAGQGHDNAVSVWDNNYALDLKSNLGKIAKKLLLSTITINQIARDVFIDRSTINKYSNIAIAIRGNIPEDFESCDGYFYDVLGLVVEDSPVLITKWDSSLERNVTNKIYDARRSGNGNLVPPELFRSFISNYAKLNRLVLSGISGINDNTSDIFKTLVHGSLSEVLLSKEEVEDFNMRTNILNRMVDVTLGVYSTNKKSCILGGL